MNRAQLSWIEAALLAAVFVAIIAIVMFGLDIRSGVENSLLSPDI